MIISHEREREREKGRGALRVMQSWYFISVVRQERCQICMKKFGVSFATAVLSPWEKWIKDGNERGMIVSFTSTLLFHWCTKQPSLRMLIIYNHFTISPRFLPFYTLGSFSFNLKYDNQQRRGMYQSRLTAIWLGKKRRRKGGWALFL